MSGAAAGEADERRRRKNRERKKKRKEKKRAEPGRQAAEGGAAMLVREATEEGEGWSSLPQRERLDRLLSRDMARRLLLAAQSSMVLFQAARKHFQACGRGAVCWYFHDPSLVALDAHGDVPVVHYLAADKVANTEHAPATGFVRGYDPWSSFVVLIAVKTGDARDSLMRSMVFGRDAAIDPLVNGARLEYRAGVGVRMPSTALVEADFSSRRRLCDATMCGRYEDAFGDFSGCALCDCVYHDRDCQRKHWKGGHKEWCRGHAAKEKK